MDLTISSLLTTVFLNSMLIVVLYLLFKSERILNKIGPKCMIIILLIAIIRMFIPFEFSYTRTIRIVDVLNPIRRILIYPLVVDPVKIIVWHILIVVWIIGIIVCLTKTIVTYAKCIRVMSMLPNESWDEICDLYNVNKETLENIDNIKLVKSKIVDSPYVFGIRKCYLILPEKKYSDEEFNYIILHELMHVKNKDIIWKIMIDVLCMGLWWNPVMHKLKKELFELIEMRNDMQIMAELSGDEKIGYMKCLKSSAEDLAGKDLSFGVSFCRSDLKRIEKRMKLMLSDNTFSKRLQLAMGVIVTIYILVTSFVIFEPHSTRVADSTGEGVALTNENTFLVKKENQYEVYVYGEYLFTTEDIAPFYGVNIYNNLEEALRNEKE